jgi:hypothetical protein
VESMRFFHTDDKSYQHWRGYQRSTFAIIKQVILHVILIAPLSFTHSTKVLFLSLDGIVLLLHKAIGALRDNCSSKKFLDYWNE